MELTKLIESILFVTPKPLSYKKLALLTSTSQKEVEDAVAFLSERFSAERSGIILLTVEDKVSLASHPDAQAIIKEYLKEEILGELTRPALETLSVVAYRGPVGKHQIEEIRGVNCTLALRNLMIRGLVDVHPSSTPDAKVYTVSFDFLRHLGVASTDKLPQYMQLQEREPVESSGEKVL